MSGRLIRGGQDAGDDDSEADRRMHDTVVTDVRPAGGRTRGVLTVSAGPCVGKVFSLPRDGIVTIGRSSECTIQLDTTTVSRVHARIVGLATGFVVSDAGSTNGSFLNGSRLQGSVLLSDGDRIQLGSAVNLNFALVDAEEELGLFQVYEAAIRDAVTGAFNRRAFEDRFEAEVAAALRGQGSVALLMFDIDFFKRVNDTYGHVAGDAVLRGVAAVLMAGVRHEDFVGRYGGEELVVLARSDAPSAIALAERLRVAVERAVFPHEGNDIRVTLSAGVACLSCCAERSRETVLRLADERLYEAKRAGRNRIVGPRS